MSIVKAFFGNTPDGRAVYSYRLTNQSGMTAVILDYAGAIQQLLVPDRRGRLVDVVCGYDNITDYCLGDGAQGSLIGRYGNRIAKGKFTLDGQEYTLSRNNGENHLHGGNGGFHRQLFAATPIEGAEPALRLTYTAADGEEGYPGTLDVTVTYTLTAENALSIHYEAVTDRPTVVNLTNHAYFNLDGFASGTVLDHMLWVDADAYLPTDAGLIPTGELRPVCGTPFDFNTPKTLGRDFCMEDTDLMQAGGYDHCLCFTGGGTRVPIKRISLSAPTTGIVMDTYTTEPCVQLYTANFLENPAHSLKGGYPQTRQSAVCLETQKMPDSPNKPHFIATVLRPGEKYDSMTVYAFGGSL